MDEERINGTAETLLETLYARAKKPGKYIAESVMQKQSRSFIRDLMISIKQIRMLACLMRRLPEPL